MIYVFAFMLCVMLLLVGFMAGSAHGYDKGFEDYRQIILEFMKEDKDD